MLLPERLCSCCAGVFESTESVPASFLLVIVGYQRTVPFTSFVSPICSVLKKTQRIQSCCIAGYCLAPAVDWFSSLYSVLRSIESPRSVCLWPWFFVWFRRTGRWSRLWSVSLMHWPKRSPVKHFSIESRRMGEIGALPAEEAVCQNKNTLWRPSNNPTTTIIFFIPPPQLRPLLHSSTEDSIQHLPPYLISGKDGSST